MSRNMADGNGVDAKFIHFSVIAAYIKKNVITKV